MSLKAPCWGLIVACLCWASGVAHAAVTIGKVRVGTDNSAKVGQAIPVFVELESDAAIDGELTLQTTDPQGNETQTVTPVKLAVGEKTTVTSTTTFGRLKSALGIEFKADGETVASKRVAGDDDPEAEAEVRLFKLDRPCWLIIGQVSIAALAGHETTEAASGSESRSASRLLADVHRTTFNSAQQLPTRFEELRLFDTIIIAGSLDMSAAQALALKQWVAAGGHLVVSIGTRASTLPGSSFATELIGDACEVSPAKIGDVEPLKSFAQTEAPIPIVQRVDGSLLKAVDGDVLIPTIDGSLAVRFARGFGRVTLLGIDLDKRPFAQWRGLNAFLVAISGLKNSDAEVRAAHDRFARTGTTELASQLNRAICQFPQVEETSVLGLLGLILLYLVIVGPVDFILVHRLLKRPDLTWVTFPIIVIGAVAVATFSARASSRSEELQVRQLEVLDIDGKSGFVRQSGWISVFSQNSGRHAIAVKQQTEFPAKMNSPRVTWFANPESTFGGLYRSAGFELGKPRYRFANDGTGVDNLPIAVHATQTLAFEAVGQWQGEIVQSTLKRSGVGQFDPASSFQHFLPVPIEDWLLAYSGRVYMHDLATGVEQSGLAPKTLWSTQERRIRSRELRSYLTGTSYSKRRKYQDATAEETVHQQTKYDITNTEVADILHMLTFHEAAGGKSYTTLKNTALSDLDLTDLISLDRAVLIGRISLPCSTLQVDGEPQKQARTEVFVRLLLPVEDGDSGSVALPKLVP